MFIEQYYFLCLMVENMIVVDVKRLTGTRYPPNLLLQHDDELPLEDNTYRCKEANENLKCNDAYFERMQTITFNMDILLAQP